MSSCSRPGVEPYALGYPRTHTLAEVRAECPDLEAGTETGERSAVTGRVMFVRNTGKLCFATLREGDGTELQVMLSLDSVGEDSLAAGRPTSTSATTSASTGEVITSRRGELSVLVDTWALTSKALRPLPVAHKPLSEETRVRQRYVDLVMRPEARDMARLRPAVVRSLRESFDARGFVEVETPMLQTLQGGAAARPFVTHANAFDLDLFLRIAPELFLKRCVVGGIERVFEINRNFRNEGADSTHSPEFAMLEFYEAYEDYDTIAALTRALIQEAAVAAYGSHDRRPTSTAPSSTSAATGRRSRCSRPLSEAVGEEITPTTPDRAAAGAGRRPSASRSTRRRSTASWSRSSSSTTSIDAFTGPTFVIDFPLDTSPLVREHRSDAGRRGEVGPLRRRLRARHRLLRAGRPGRPAAAASRSRRGSRPAATSRRCRSTRTSCAPWSTACRRWAAWAWASTGCSWC